MISLPSFQRLSVHDYGMYPGRHDGDGLTVEFRPGLTLILGANGLGKTTLVTMMFRLLTGPWDIPGLSRGSELGNRNLEPTRLPPSARRQFAARVTDAASNSSASLEFRLGERAFVVERSLADLSLVSFEVDGEARPIDERSFKETVVDAADLASFGDWILALRHLVFYFEDRRALVWDPSAQRQILRLLFLPADVARKWTALEREILERDSRMRNLQAALTREEVAVSKVEEALGARGDVQQELDVLQELQRVDQSRLNDLNGVVSDLDAERQRLRRDRLKAEVDREHAYRNSERLQLQAIHALFPSSDDTARYLFAKLFSDDTCLACGSRSPSTATALRDRLARHACLVCGSDMTPADAVPIAPRAFANATRTLRAAEQRLDATSSETSQVESRFAGLITDIQRLNLAVAERDLSIESLVKRLPAKDADLVTQHDELRSLLL